MQRAALLRPCAVSAAASAPRARAFGAAAQRPDRRRLNSLAAAARRRLIVSSVFPPPARRRASVAVRARGDSDEGDEDDGEFDDDDEEFDEEELLAEFGEDFEGDDEFDDDEEEESARAGSGEKAVTDGDDEEEEVVEPVKAKKSKSEASKSTSESTSVRSDAAAADSSSTPSPSSSPLPPAPVRGAAARASASASARASAASTSEEEEEDVSVSEDEAYYYSAGAEEEDELFDEETEAALAEAEDALEAFLRNEPSKAAAKAGKGASKSSAKEASEAAKPQRLDADLAAKALDSVAAAGDDAAFRAEAGIPDDLFAAQEEFDDATGKVKVIPGLPPPRRWLRRVADQGPVDVAKWALRELKAKVDHERAVPYIGNAYISYARLLELLSTRSVAKLTILAGGRCAIVETPVVGFAVDVGYAAAEPGSKEFTALQSTALPQWGYEVTRFYCDLPGDVWEQGTLMRLAKDAATQTVQEDGLVRSEDQPYLWDAPQTELVVRPPDSAFLFVTQNKGLAVPIAALLGIRTALVVAAKGMKMLFPRGGGFFPWSRSKAKEDDEEVADLLGELGRTSAIQFNVEAKGGKGKKKKDTGVRYSDVAGIDSILFQIKEVVSMLLRQDSRYEEIGASPPRGIIFAGPPGTGKTLLAKAMAGEAGVPFFACSGSEFVEMYSGVAAARIRDLFKLARKVAPSIIFIDEIDAIARSRTLNAAGGGGGGALEREQGLLQLLVEMDGFERDDRVLVIGATNLVESMDAAILRPGRFGKILRLDPPRVRNRWRILRLHATGKPLDRSGDDVVERATGERADALLWRAAQKTKGWSGAELANLMNEAAILMVRHDKDKIDWEILAEALEKRDLTAKPSPPPKGEAGRRLALIHAARAVASAITPGFPRVDGVGIDGRGAMVARIKFDSVDYFRSGDGSARLLFGPRPQVDVAGKTDAAKAELEASGLETSDEDLEEERASALRLPAGVTALPVGDEALEEVRSYRGRGPRGSGAAAAVAAAADKTENSSSSSSSSSSQFAPPTAYEAACGLLVPLLTARAAEALFFGAAEGTTLASAREVAAAGDYSFWLATTSNMHPARARHSPTARFLPADEEDRGRDNLSRYARSSGEAEAAKLQRAAFGRAKRLLRRWRPAVEELAEAMLAAPDGSVEGELVAAVLARNVPPPPGHRLPGGAAVGGTRFLRALGAGRPGIAVFGSAAASRSFAGAGGEVSPATALEEWSSAGVDLSDEAAVAAVEAVAGALSGQDLTASGLSAAAKRRLAAALTGGGSGKSKSSAEEAELVKQRLAAVRAYVSSPGEGADEPPFPPPPLVGVEGGFDAPPEAGPGSLASWVPELAGPSFAAQARGKGLLGFPRE